MIGEGDNFRPFLRALNRSYIDLNLTIGGVADMLGIGYGYLVANGEIGLDDNEDARKVRDRQEMQNEVQDKRVAITA